MTDRLVLGSGSLAEMLVESLDDRPGSVRLGTGDETLASTVRQEGIHVEELDVSDADALRGVTDVDIVFVVEDEHRVSVATARAVRNASSEVYLMVYAGTDVEDADSTLEGVADRVVYPNRAVANFVLERAGPRGRRLRELLSVLRDIDRLGVFTHDNPDPDAIASGVALARLATAAGCSVDVCYYGNISHQENRAFVNVLELELTNLDVEDDLSEYDGFALVDHSRPGVNDSLPADTPIDVVIDHHPPRAPVDARFVDLRSDVGATSTLLVDYLEQYGVAIDEDVATALLFGIHVDTNSFSREVCQQDFEAAAVLVSVANLGTLERIESPSIDSGTFDTIASAIGNRQVEEEVVLSCVDRLSNRDALAQAADRLLMLEGITTSMVYGVMEGVIYASARTRSPEVDIGETLRSAFDRIGSAGGHVDMAGAQIELGILDAVEDQDESLNEIVEGVVADRFLEALTSSAGTQVTGLYPSEIDVTDEYLGTTDEYLGTEAQSGDLEGNTSVDEAVPETSGANGDADTGSGGASGEEDEPVDDEQ